MSGSRSHQSERRNDITLRVYIYIEYRIGKRQEYADEIYLLDAYTISLSEVSREVLRKSQLLGKIFARIQRYNYVLLSPPPLPLPFRGDQVKTNKTNITEISRCWISLFCDIMCVPGIAARKKELQK